MNHRGNGPARPETRAKTLFKPPLPLLVEQKNTLLELESFLQAYRLCRDRSFDLEACVFGAMVEILGDLRAQNTCLLTFFNPKGGAE